MRVILSAMFVAIFATASFAQGKGPPTPDESRVKAAKAAGEREKQRAAEEIAAKEASSKIPDSKEKYDPWKIAR